MGGQRTAATARWWWDYLTLLKLRIVPLLVLLGVVSCVVALGDIPSWTVLLILQGIPLYGTLQGAPSGHEIAVCSLSSLVVFALAYKQRST